MPVGRSSGCISSYLRRPGWARAALRSPSRRTVRSPVAACSASGAYGFSHHGRNERKSHRASRSHSRTVAGDRDTDTRRRRIASDGGIPDGCSGCTGALLYVRSFVPSFRVCEFAQFTGLLLFLAVSARAFTDPAAPAHAFSYAAGAPGLDRPDLLDRSACSENRRSHQP